MKFRHFFVFILLILLSGCWKGDFSQNAIKPQPEGNQIVNQPENSQPTSSSEVILEETLDAPSDLPAVEDEPQVEPEEPEEEIIPKPEENKTFDFLNYPVLFASQAPFANWDELHEEACEEAAMIMAVKYFKNEPLSPHIMEQGILNLVEWEKENGYKVDLSANETVEVLKNYFSQSSKIITDVTFETIKRKLLDGNLIIVPAAGRQLGNPNFTGEGPIYHMLVVRGYDDKTNEFITNDPGTRKGEGYRYKYQKLIDAVHDWDHSLAEGGMINEEMEQWRKVMIAVTK
jgi:hypothetical protein